MALHVTQLAQYRRGRPAHWVALEIACSHGRVDGSLRLVGLDRLPAGPAARASVQASHDLVHRLIAAHRRRTGCTCAALVSLFCWPRVTGSATVAFTVSRSRN